MQQSPFSITQDLKKRIYFLIAALIVFRFGTHITIPFINPEALASLVEDQKGTILDMFNMFSGGALERLSLFT
jgi:preprotein translocase subunit SecY